METSKWEIIKDGVIPSIIIVSIIATFILYIFYSYYSSGGECEPDFQTGNCDFR